jgi:hypothetical protein
MSIKNNFMIELLILIPFLGVKKILTQTWYCLQINLLIINNE